MFKKEGEFEEGGETVIARGVKLEGDFNSQGNVNVEGEVSGSLSTTSDLKVGDSAKICANIKAKNAVVAGEIDGNTKIEEKLELLASAKINGDIDTKVLSITPGAQINGKISMGGSVSVVAEPTIPKNNKSKKTEKSPLLEEEEMEL